MNIQSNIKKIRKVQGLTQETFGRNLGVSVAQQKSYELGKAQPGIVYLEKLAALSGFTTTELMHVDLMVEDIEGRMVEGKKFLPIYTNEAQKGEIDYKQLYIESLQKRVADAEGELKVLRDTLKTNLATIQVLLQSLSNQVNAQSTVTMKALDRVFDQPEGTLAEASDKLEVKLWERIAQIAGRAGIPLEINVNS